MMYLIWTLAAISYAAALASTIWSIQQVLYVVSLPNLQQQVGSGEFRPESLNLLWTEAAIYILGMSGLLALGGYSFWLLIKKLRRVKL